VEQHEALDAGRRGVGDPPPPSGRFPARNAPPPAVLPPLVAIAPLAELERLGETLAQPAPSKRMLIVVNPYATTVSDRLKNLVVYALRGRYQVEAVETQSRDHATAL
jgi:hypothetical protein